MQQASPTQAQKEGLKQLKKDLSNELRIDQEHAKLCQQEHTKKMQALYDEKQKIGNKIITGQYKGRNNAALQAIKIDRRWPSRGAPSHCRTHREMLYQEDGLRHRHNDWQIHAKRGPRQYPWEQDGALETFKLETAITTGASCTPKMASPTHTRCPSLPSMPQDPLTWQSPWAGRGNQ
jgi:hypothetical protein